MRRNSVGNPGPWLTLGLALVWSLVNRAAESATTVPPPAPSIVAREVGAENPAKGGEKTALADRATAEFFAGPFLNFEVTLGPKEMDSLREDTRKAVPATVRIDGQIYESVAVHVKGSAGSRRGIDDNPALTLNFSKFKPGQTFRGLKKLHLNNSVQDSSRLTEILAAALYRRAGIPVARATQGFMRLNGEDRGIYVVKEGFDKTWLRRNFTDPTGNLYDGGFVRDIDNDLERDEGTGPEDRKDLEALAKAAELREVGPRREALGALLDLDQFTTFCAMQNTLSDWDGYVYNHNNYRLYHDPRSGRFTFIPHGMDQLFGDSGFPINRGMSGLVARQVLSLPGQRERMFDRIQALLTNVFTSEVVLPVVADVEERMKVLLAKRPRSEREYMEREIEGTRERVEARMNNLRQQLMSRPRPLKFDTNGLAVITGWAPRTEGGKSRSDAGPAPDGTKSLVLETPGEGATASWRKRLRIPAGNYAFEARVRCAGVESRTDAQGKGLGLRVAGRNRQNSLEGDTGWSILSEPIEADGDREFELVVELRANAGKAWIDQDSLRLRRK